MARPKKTKKRAAPKRRRSMGAVGSKSTLMNTAKLAVGLAAGSIVATALDRNLSRMNPKLLNIAKIVGGVAFTDSANNLIKGAAFGIAASGSIGLAANVGLLQRAQSFLGGVFEDQYMIDENVNGIGISDFVSGLPSNEVVQTPMSDDGMNWNPGTLGSAMGLGS